MEHVEVIKNDRVERVLMEFKDAAECVPRGICRPDEAHVVISKYFIAFIGNEGEVRLVRDGKLHAEVRVNNTRLVTDSWDMFVFRSGSGLINSPRLAVGNAVFTTDEFIEFIRRGFQSIMLEANWV
jgi:hypothetical protein